MAKESKIEGEGCAAAVGLIIVAVVLLASCGGCLASFCGGIMPDYSEGQRAGKLIKISKKGMIWKSWEGQIVLNEFAIGGDGSNRFDFSTMDDEVGKELSKHLGKEISVDYHQYLIRPIQQSTGYAVTKVEIIEHK